ncbi:hypothetical protein RJT34_07352 [Clitoria ternatea]|uniref:Uncharacterized protein n=1 Tax=Clitoria ternatea TaxID=43366 RepID=A0AAN9K3C6_CLITE
MLRMSWDSKDRTTLSLNMGNVAADVVEKDTDESQRRGSREQVMLYQEMALDVSGDHAKLMNAIHGW